MGIKVSSKKGRSEALEKYVSDGLREEKKRLEFALKSTRARLEEFEKRFNKSTEEFLTQFKAGAVEENPETFEWWAETKLLKELEEQMSVLENIEICRE